MKFYKSSFIHGVLALLSVLLLMPMQSNAVFLKMKVIEEAIEAEKVKIRWREDRLGEISGSKCMSCKTWRLKITEDTKAFQDNKLTDIKLITKRKTPSVVIFYDPKTDEVTRITW